MKVLTIKEPYVNLIKNGIKHIETRSWKTNYRGELYIHAGLSKISKDELNNKDLMNLVDLNDLNYGKIVLKANLTDCIYMDEDFIKKIKQNKNEYICGYYEIGRYAWILGDVKVLDKPIEAKGKLGIWNYK